MEQVIRCEECGTSTDSNYGNEDIVLCEDCRDVFYEVCPSCWELTNDLNMRQSRATIDVFICEQCHRDGG